MAYEVEMKFPIEDVPAFLARLAAYEVSALGAERQEDRYFQHPARDFRQTDESLRIRCVGPIEPGTRGHAAQTALVRLTYKGPKIDLLTKTRREIELELAPGGSPEALADRLVALGFRPAGRVVKERSSFMVERSQTRIEVVVDAVEGLGPYVELEAAAEEDSLVRVRQVVMELAAELGLAGGERRSYLQLLEEVSPGTGGTP